MLYQNYVIFSRFTITNLQQGKAGKARSKARPIEKINTTYNGSLFALP